MRRQPHGVILRREAPKDPGILRFAQDDRPKGVTMRKFNLREKFGLFEEPYQPKIVGELNDHQVKVVKILGDFVWHHHANEDELFLVVRGRMRMGLRSGDVDLAEGDVFIVPRGVEHKPFAQEECWVVLIEPGSTLNTGNVIGEKTVAELERI